YRLFDLSDGLAGLPLVGPGNRSSAWKDSALFVTHGGITSITPNDLRQDPDPGTVRLDSISADGRAIPIATSVRVPRRTSRIDVEYSMLNLTSQSKVRFRYRLEGFDADWVLAGTKRQASYTNLAPGHYNFVVEADPSAGAWGHAVTTAVFV